MADNIAITAGAGTTVVTEDRTEGHYQRVLETGSDSIVVGSASVTTTSASAVAARARRKVLILIAKDTNTDTITVGPSGVASGTGPTLRPGASLTLYFAGALHADAASGTQTLEYIELYD
jgi:hypothetical protein